MLRVMPATIDGSMRNRCMASRNAVRRPIPGSLDNSSTTSVNN